MIAISSLRDGMLDRDRLRSGAATLGQAISNVAASGDGERFELLGELIELRRYLLLVADRGKFCEAEVALVQLQCGDTSRAPG